MSDIVLVTSYCGGVNPQQKEHMTRTICKKIKEQGLPVCLATHSPVPVDIQEYWNKERIKFSSALLDHQKLKKTKFVFSNKITKNQASIEYINQFHPIIKFISEALQKKYLSNPKKIVTASSVRTSQIDIPEDVYIYACQRFSFTSSVRVIERLEYRAKGLNSSKPLSAEQSELLVNAITAEGKNWAGYGSIDTDHLFEKYGELLSKLENDFEARKNQLKREIGRAHV